MKLGELFGAWQDCAVTWGKFEARPGMQIQLEDGRELIIGDCNVQGGSCGCCLVEVGLDARVVRWRFLVGPPPELQAEYAKLIELREVVTSVLDEWAGKRLGEGHPEALTTDQCFEWLEQAWTAAGGPAAVQAKQAARAKAKETGDRPVRRRKGRNAHDKAE